MKASKLKLSIEMSTVPSKSIECKPAVKLVTSIWAQTSERNTTITANFWLPTLGLKIPIMLLIWLCLIKSVDIFLHRLMFSQMNNVTGQFPDKNSTDKEIRPPRMWSLTQCTVSKIQSRSVGCWNGWIWDESEWQDGINLGDNGKLQLSHYISKIECCVVHFTFKLSIPVVFVLQWLPQRIPV